MRKALARVLQRRRPVGSLDQIRGRIALQQAGHDFADDASADGTQVEATGVLANVCARHER